MKKWIPCELHTHTHHSDGRFTVIDLAKTAKKCGLEYIAITDHNTMIPQEEMNSAIEETGIGIINGLEWTTFYGHMVVLGASDYVDWRNIGIENIHDGIARVHDLGGIAGIAHPFRVGSPLCTGCFWQYDIKDWNDIDYIEVWSQFSPSMKESNQRALELWTDLLNKGYKITGTYGLDWHGKYAENHITATSYIQVDDSLSIGLEEQLVDAIKNGKVSITIGPLLELTIKDKASSKECGIGEEIIIDHEKVLDFNVNIDYNVRKTPLILDNESLCVVLNSNNGVLKEWDVLLGQNGISSEIPNNQLSWVRTELYGYINGIKTLIAFTNPIYFTSRRN